MIHTIYLAPTKMEANIAFDIFIEEFDAKYPKAVDCLRRHQRRKLDRFGMEGNLRTEKWFNHRESWN